MRPMAPFAGVATFAGAPHVALPDGASALRDLRPHFVVFGVPYDGGVGYRPGQRMAPRSVRDASGRLRMAWGRENPGYWDLRQGRRYLAGAQLVDGGDVEPLYGDHRHLVAGVAAIVAAVRSAGAVPVAIGGDHSITFPLLRALAPSPANQHRPLHVVQIDAHLDFTDNVAGYPWSNSSPLRRAVELDHVGTITSIGLRGIRTDEAAWQVAVDRGHGLVVVDEVRAAGLEGVRKSLPVGADVYVTIDIDGLDPAIAPGTSSPEPDGLTYGEVRGILGAVAAANRVVGCDLVEVNPYLDPSGRTSLMAARLLVELLAEIHATGRPVLYAAPKLL